MITIYLDGSAALEPDLAGRLTHLVGSGARARPRRPAPITRPRALPSGPADLTALPERAGAGLLVPHRGPGHAAATARPACGRSCRSAGRRASRPTRCDSTARDLREAVLEILSAARWLSSQ